MCVSDILKLLPSLALFATLASAAEFETSLTKATTYESIHSFYPQVSPVLAVGARTLNYGAAIGLVDREDTVGKSYMGYGVMARHLEVTAIQRDGKVAGGMAIANFNFGGASWEWWPAALEVGIGSTLNGHESHGVFEVGYFFGTPATFNFGIAWYTPLATGYKPAWFPDWAWTVRMPFQIATGTRTREQTTRTILDPAPASKVEKLDLSAPTTNK